MLKYKTCSVKVLKSICLSAHLSIFNISRRINSDLIIVSATVYIDLREFKQLFIKFVAEVIYLFGCDFH